MKIQILSVVVMLFALVNVACGGSNVCEKQLEFEETDCFPELEQPTTVEKDECTGDMKEYAKCATKNEDAYCDYFLWQNRGAARLEGYTVSDTLPPGNDFVECLDEAGLRQQ